MELPEQLEQKLQENQKCQSWVFSFIGKFEPWFNENRMVFFDEYTNHSITHVEEVLQTTVDLMTEEALLKITPQDAAALIIGVCLHDSAMHLSEDGFFTLIKLNSNWKPIAFFDSKPWHQLWIEFLGEARRFDGRKLLSLFGDIKPVRSPPENPIDLTKRDRLLIGEFLRRHHARLSHEMALYGVPSIEGTPYKLNSDIDNIELINLSGAIARSHGISLRKSVDYLRQEKALRDFQGIHAVYLMVLLRIADYLQIQERRAPSEILMIRKLTSPISQSEWKVHHCVRNITLADEDPEAIFIDVAPDDVHTYLRVKQWLEGIQSELDMSWAILGEVYGRYEREGYNNLNLQLRRIRSSLDEKDKFNKSVGYIPEKVAFEASNSDLLKLLIGPLYGERPSVGIREIVQNSVDAVRELEDLKLQNTKFRMVQSNDIPSDIFVEIVFDKETKKPLKVVITDKGVGMTLDILKNYFLNAGASFRKSDAWKKQHENDSGKSRVIRSGRFGIGALAAFLVGDEISVTTRHAEEDTGKGFQFSAKLDEEAISINRVECAVGTKLEINIPEPLRTHVNKDFFKESEHFNAEGDALKFYLLPKPSLTIKVTYDNSEVRPYVEVPTETDNWLYPWRYFEHSLFEKIFWTFSSGVEQKIEKVSGSYKYSRKEVVSYPDFTCNGIVIKKGESVHSSNEPNNWLHSDKKIRPSIFCAPKISLFDKNGNLPLNLQRTAVQDEGKSFSHDLWQSILEDFLAYALVTSPTKEDIQNSCHKWLHGSYPGFKNSNYHFEYGKWSYYGNNRITPHWFITKNGVGFLDSDIFTKLDMKTAIVGYGFSYKGETDWYSEDIIPHLDEKELFLNSCMKIYGSINVKKNLIRMIMNCNETIFGKAKRASFTGRHLLVTNAFIRQLLNANVIAKDLVSIINNSTKVKETELWTVYSFGTCLPLSDIATKIINKKPPQGFEVFSFDYYNNDNCKDSKSGVLSSKWFEILKEPIIPFDTEDRKRVFNRAYLKLMPQISLNEMEFVNIGSEEEGAS